MCKSAQIRSCRLLTAAVALLWCAAAAADSNVQQTVNNSAQRGSKLGQIRPVTSDFDIDVSNHYRKDIQKRYAAQDLKMDEALRLIKDQKFRNAVQIAEAVRDELKLEAEFVKGEIISARLAEAEALVARLRIAWGRERLKKANEAFVKNQLTEARVLAGEAAQITSALKEEAEAVQKLCLASERNAKFKGQTSLAAANPKLSSIRQEAQNLMSEAKVFFENKRYAQALDKIEQVYLRDPFNLEAVALAGQIYREFFTKGYYRHRSDFELQSAYTTWQWIEPIFEAPEAPKEITVQEKGDSRKAMSDKLSSAILPQFTWNKGDARGAINRLRTQAKAYDIDIQDFTTRDDAPTLGSVSLDLNNVSVGDVLRYISLMSGVKYRIEPDAVVVGTAIETMYDRKYEVQPHVLTYVISNTSSETGNSGGGDSSTNSNVFGSRRGGQKDRNAQTEKRLNRENAIAEELPQVQLSGEEVTGEKFKEYLTKHGIKFSEDCLVGWNRLTNVLTVKSTLENLDAISQLIREQNALQASLILVEVKCIEISDNDMEELGFDWSLGDNLNKNMNNDGTLKDPNQKGWMFGPGTNYRVNDKGERGSMNPIRTGFMDGSSSTALINNLNIFPMLFGSKTPFGSDVPINISLTVNALSQNTRTEVVSAPKIVAMSGISASAKMTKSFYFPDSWSDLEIETDTSDNDTTYTIQRPTPEFGDEEEIGIDMKVTPTIMNETGAINLKLDFEVTGTNGNDEFTFVLNGNVNGRPVSHTFTIWKPVITERKINTDVDVYDGQTVVIGGSTDNRTVTRNDKIPFLGELPLIGRLFQAQSEKAERRNMLVFVTARKLDTDGSAVKNFNQGAPDFNR